MVFLWLAMFRVQAACVPVASIRRCAVVAAIQLSDSHFSRRSLLKLILYEREGFDVILLAPDLNATCVMVNAMQQITSRRYRHAGVHGMPHVDFDGGQPRCTKRRS